MADAKRWIELGDYSNALSALRPFAVQPEKYPRHFSDYIVILFWNGNPEQAIGLFETMPGSIPKRDYLKRNIAKAYFDLGFYQKAIGLYQSVLEGNSGDATALKGLILSMDADGQTQQAADRINQTLKESGENAELRLIHADLHFKMKRYSESFDAYSLLIDRFKDRREAVVRQRNNQFASLPRSERLLALDQIKAEAKTGNLAAASRLVVLSALFRDYREATETFKFYGLRPEEMTTDAAYWAGWSFFQTGKPEKALAIFETVLNREPENLQCQIGKTYCLADTAKGRAALGMIEKLAAKHPRNFEILYAEAYVHEREGGFLEAIRVYDRMLAISPDARTVRLLRIRAFSDMGATTRALMLAESELGDDRNLAFEMAGDAAVDRIRWDEPAAALKILPPPSETLENDRYNCDRIIALNRNEQHMEAVSLFESLLADGKAPPEWTTEAAAGSYLYLEQPERALELYNQVLENSPDSSDALWGKLYALQELRSWDAARKWLDQMDAAAPEYLGRGRSRRYNPEKLDLQIAGGWFPAYQNHLKEADARFRKLHDQAPANVEIRSGLAHVHLWRGWPRRALEEFEVIRSMDPEYLASETGRIAALNELAYKAEARKEADSLLNQHPEKKWVKKLVREFEVEQMNENRFEFSYSREEGGANDIFIRDAVSAPLSLLTRLHGFVLWRRTWDDDPDETAKALGDDEATYFKRAGLGVRHIFNKDWTAVQQFSVNYDDAEEFGTLTRVAWTPDDHWRFSAYYDSFSTDVAKRARAAGVSAKKASLGVGRRESEWREYNLYISRQLFSDDNKRDEILIGCEQNLFVKNDWRMRAYLNFYGTKNSGWNDLDIDYYNPKNAWELSLTHMTEQTVWDLYDESFVHRLYLTVGVHDQHDYASGMTGSIRYEQEYEFSDVQYFFVGISLGRNRYDGENVDSIATDLVWTVRF